MNREFLKGLGLEDEVIEKVMTEHGKTVTKAKEDLTSVTIERDSLKTQLSDRDTQLENLSKQVKDNDDLTKEINRLKQENTDATQKLQDKLNQQAYDFALERALIDAKSKNPKAVKALLNTEAIKLDGDKLLGLEEQLKTLSESDGYLFAQEEDPAAKIKGFTPGDGKKPPAGSGKNPFSKEHFNLTEQARLYKENPDLYKQLKAQAGK